LYASSITILVLKPFGEDEVEHGTGPGLHGLGLHYFHRFPDCPCWQSLRLRLPYADLQDELLAHLGLSAEVLCIPEPLDIGVQIVFNLDPASSTPQTVFNSTPTVTVLDLGILSDCLHMLHWPPLRTSLAACAQSLGPRLLTVPSFPASVQLWISGA
jgi:hypothetical protein